MTVEHLDIFSGDFRLFPPKFRDETDLMKITLVKDSTCGKIEVPSGEYMVALAADTGQFSLIGAGKTHKIPATRRRAAGKSRVTTVSLIPGGGSMVSLIMSTPKQGEWIAMLEVRASARERSSKKS